MGASLLVIELPGLTLVGGELAIVLGASVVGAPVVFVVLLAAVVAIVVVLTVVVLTVVVFEGEGLRVVVDVSKVKIVALVSSVVSSLVTV